MGSQEDRQLTLLGLLAWEERTEQWLSFPQDAREAVTQELARLIVRVAVEESRDEQRGQDHEPPS